MERFYQMNNHNADNVVDFEERRRRRDGGAAQNPAELQPEAAVSRESALNELLFMTRRQVALLLALSNGV